MTAGGLRGQSKCKPKHNVVLAQKRDKLKEYNCKPEKKISKNKPLCEWYVNFWKSSKANNGMTVFSANNDGKIGSPYAKE